MEIKKLYSLGMNKDDKKREKREVPVCLALVVCDSILREEGTHKLSLFGLFNSIAAASFPTRHAKMHIYAAVTNYVGEATGKLKFSAPGGDLLAELSGSLNFPDKLAVVELNFVINGMVFPRPGAYTIEFFVADHLIQSRDVQITELKRMGR